MTTASDDTSFLLLFLSVDVIGSTDYKNKNRETTDVQPWLQFFTDFYGEFPEYLNDACERQRTLYKNDDQQRATPLPEVWKTAGDELIFTAKITCHRDALQCLMAFKVSIEAYAKATAAKDLPLRFKGCAWVAGFPVINAVVRHGTGKAGEDYIGPLIDAGFRLTKFADERKLVLSVELALLLAQALIDDTREDKPQVFCDGKKILRGVFQEAPYPILWIDMQNGPQFDDEKAIGSTAVGAQWPKLIDFCQQYIKSLSPSLVIPYLQSCDCFYSIPPAHQEIIAKRQKNPMPLELLSQGDTEPQDIGRNTVFDDPIISKT